MPAFTIIIYYSRSIIIILLYPMIDYLYIVYLYDGYYYNMEISAKEETLYERYKQQKLTISAGFISIILKFLTIVLLLYIPLSLIFIKFHSNNYVVPTILLVISIAIQVLKHNSNMGYYLGILLTTLLSIRFGCFQNLACSLLHYRSFIYGTAI